MKIPLSLPPTPQQVDVICLGENSLDIVAIGEAGVDAGAKTKLDALTWLPGGQAATAAIACARLGWRSRYIGCIGDDQAGAQIELALTAAGVDVKLTRRPATRTRTAIVLVDRSTGNRTVLEYREPNLQWRAGEIDDASIVSGRLLLVDGSDVAASGRAAELARHAGIPILVDADRMVDGIEGLLASVDVIIVPESFARTLTGLAEPRRALVNLASRFSAAVIVATLGDRGSVAVCRGREIRTEAPAVSARDTTGAGDAFRAGFAAGWLEGGVSAELERVLAIANAVAALACREVGAQAGLPTREEVAALL